MIGLGDLLACEAGGQIRLFAASGMGGGVSLRAPGAGLTLRGAVEYGAAMGLSAPRELHVVQIDGAQVLLAPGQYGTGIEGWTLNADGTLGAARPLTQVGGMPGAVTALEQLHVGGQHVFITASRHAPGLEVWTRDGDRLTATGLSGTANFLGAGAVQATALATPGGVPYLLAANTQGDDLLAFRVLPGGELAPPTRLDLRDGLYIDTPTRIETVELGGQSYAILGSAGSSSVSVVALSPAGRMQVTHQVNDTVATRFDNLAALEVLETQAGVFVLVAGRDNGLTLLGLHPGGRLVHLASLGDEMREMALIDPGGLEMVWRAGGLDIFVSGAVLDADNAGGRGVTHLRVDDLAGKLPQVHENDAGFVQTGTPGEDLFVVADTDAPQTVRDFQPGIDRLDLSQMGRFHDVSDLDITRLPNGAVIRFEGAEVRIFTKDGSSLGAQDFTNADVQDLWHIETARPDPAGPRPPLTGGRGPDLLDGREGADILLGEPQDAGSDACAAQIFRLYQATLGRDPDLTGLINWSRRLETGERVLAEIVDGFTNSAEFRQSYGDADNRAFVTLLYDNVLDRAPDDRGLANWTGRLDRGEMSRAQVVLGFSESAEFRSATVADALAYSHVGVQVRFSDDIYRLYRATLDRDPDLNGFLNWTARLADGMPFLTAVSGFVNSAEFAQTYGATGNEAFVTLLYDNVLDRAPDDRGLANWTGRLDRGEMSRAQVVQGFAQSHEFTAATRPDLIRWVKAQGKDDVLDGAGGDNILMGGMMSDTFVFRAADDGRHVVVDPEPWDILRLEGFGYDSAADVAPHLQADGEDTMFSDAGVTIRFIDTGMQDVLDLVFEF